LKGMTFYAFHGVSPEERALGQRFVVDVDIERDLSVPGRSDNLQDTVDYSKVYPVIQQVMSGPSRNLLEAVAEAIAREILGEFPVEAVRVRVEKPRLSFAELPASASVEIYRERAAS